jgi:aminoglycoside 6-adenylyltransferase
MNQSPSSVWDRLEQNIATWAAKETGISAAVAVGSRARLDPPADEWSDLDVMLFMHDPASHVHRTDWVAEIGEPIMAIPGRTVNNDPERLVIFSGGYNVDFVFLPVGAIDYLVKHGTAIEPFGRGARVLTDKDGRLQKLFSPDQPNTKMPVNSPPSAEDFERGVLSFWFSAYYTAKMLRRGDLWTARATDNQMKETLTSLLTLHAIVVHKREDTWFRGRFMKRWADSQALDDIPNLFWHYDDGEAWQALLTSITLFQRLSTEIASSLQYPIPHDIARRMSEMIHGLCPAK